PGRRLRATPYRTSSTVAHSEGVEERPLAARSGRIQSAEKAQPARTPEYCRQATSSPDAADHRPPARDARARRLLHPACRLRCARVRAQAPRRSAPICLSHTTSWFQLANVRLTTHSKRFGMLPLISRKCLCLRGGCVWLQRV